MQKIELVSTPNQTFDLSLSNLTWSIRIKKAKDCFIADVVKNGETVILGTRLIPGVGVIPCRYQEDGNFVLVTQDYDGPDYTKFGTSQFLFYFTQDEIDAARAIEYSPITADFFDANGGLPDAFSPSGYAISEPAPPTPPDPVIDYVTAPDGTPLYTPAGDEVYFPEP